MAINPPGPTSPLLTEAQAAAYLGVKPTSLLVWRSTGAHRIPFVRVGRLIRYRQADLDAWIASRVRTVA
jgi:excisionase family DNA binding protein